MSGRYVIILAAGQGTRMKSKLYKVLHPVCGKPMVEHVIDTVSAIGADQIVTVIGHGAELVKKQLEGKTEFVLQKEQLGTAHAVSQAKGLLKDKEGTTLVVCGDTPLLTAETVEKLLRHHEEEQAAMTVLTTIVDDPTGYGRVVRNEKGHVERIVEHKDATDEERKITEINTGTYCFNNADLFSALEKVSNDNAQGEYYLPDVFEILRKEGRKVTAYSTKDVSETIGVNDRVALAQAEKIMQRRINESHMRNGVTIIDPDNTYIEANVKIGQDTIIYPGTILKGETEIGSDCKLGPNSEIVNCRVGDGTTIHHSVAFDSVIGSYTQIGPFSHIRPKSDINDEVRIGNFVEIKKSVIGHQSKVSHLSYIGDAEVGSNVNVGCGSITVNYDGTNKYKTVIEDGAFIGCNTNLIAPVTVGEGAFIAAGSTITDDVPKNALSIARARQINKDNYAEKLKQKK